MMVKLRKNFLKILSACLLLVAMLGCSSSKDEDVSDYIQGKFDLNNPITSVDSTPDDFENDDDSILTLKEKDPNDVEQEDNLDCWIGEYLLEESDNCGRDDGYFISMVTSIEIYKEDNQFYFELRDALNNCWYYGYDLSRLVQSIFYFTIFTKSAKRIQTKQNYFSEVLLFFHLFGSA